jgi:hypothetical protein
MHSEADFLYIPEATFLYIPEAAVVLASLVKELDFVLSCTLRFKKKLAYHRPKLATRTTELLNGQYMGGRLRVLCPQRSQ